MRQGFVRSRSSWRAPEMRVARPELWLLATGLVGMLLVEVWQSSRMAELAMIFDQNRSALEQAHARLDYVRADLERRTTRAELAPLAEQLGLAPADAQQVVVLPSVYLAAQHERPRDGTSVSLLAWAERASRALVPEATARDRAGN
ncbi:MAG TPA: hypothetical protein VEY91_01945 [Candidatus Limnocylindria bacterium]|nr:hypothetical protein [Candidatus Limnocylindria bacterium]